jgi:hypothetical protein
MSKESNTLLNKISYVFRNGSYIADIKETLRNALDDSSYSIESAIGKSKVPSKANDIERSILLRTLKTIIKNPDGNNEEKIREQLEVLLISRDNANLKFKIELLLTGYDDEIVTGLEKHLEGILELKNPKDYKIETNVVAKKNEANDILCKDIKDIVNENNKGKTSSLRKSLQELLQKTRDIKDTEYSDDADHEYSDDTDHEAPPSQSTRAESATKASKEGNKEGAITQ